MKIVFGFQIRVLMKRVQVLISLPWVLKGCKAQKIDQY